MFDSLAELDVPTDESALVERISALERLKSAAAAAHARATAALDEKRRAAEALRGVPAAKRGRGLTSEVALARFDAPVLGNRHLGFARALVDEMPHTLAALEAGVLSEWRATLIVRESACLTVEDRRVNLVISDETLLAGDDSPARVEGYGPIPAGVARRLIAGASCDERSRATLRRLYKHPSTGALVAMESKSRFFPKGLATFIALRDDTCRMPYCDAPIRHTDHASPRARGGPTDGRNGVGSCEACNYAKEAPGWTVHVHGDERACHTTDYTTPTGAVHRSKAPPLPGRVRFDLSVVELTLAIDPATHERAA